MNRLIKDSSAELAAKIRHRDLAPDRWQRRSATNTAGIKGEFPHKTEATTAGLGWIGRNCQLVTPAYGPWVRLGTVFVDLELPCGPPAERDFCGRCFRCSEACPAKALKKKAWLPEISREEILDVGACDQWKKEHYFQYHNGHNCGICPAVCPYG